MKKKHDMKDCLYYIDLERKTVHKSKIMWIVLAAFQAALGTYSIVVNGWLNAEWILYLVITLLCITLAVKEEMRDNDLRMLSDSIKMMDHMLEAAKEFHNKVQELISEDETEAKEQQE